MMKPGKQRIIKEEETFLSYRHKVNSKQTKSAILIVKELSLVKLTFFLI